eukprot:m.318095 g.318095  ORF g.318095 m.318095 type:complete len:50 (+) comp15989_c0_seq15:1146-1295(+)
MHLAINVHAPHSSRLFSLMCPLDLVEAMFVYLLHHTRCIGHCNGVQAPL